MLYYRKKHYLDVLNHYFEDIFGMEHDGTISALASILVICQMAPKNYSPSPNLFNLVWLSIWNIL